MYDVTRVLECGDQDMVPGPPGCKGWAVCLPQKRQQCEAEALIKSPRSGPSPLNFIQAKTNGHESKHLLMGKKNVETER